MSAQNSAGEPSCEITGAHVWGYHGVTMPGGYSKPVSGPVCLVCGEWKGPEQVSAICPSVSPQWPASIASTNDQSDDEVYELLYGPCTVPPPGWRCTRGYHADGPCAALPVKKPMWGLRAYTTLMALGGSAMLGSITLQFHDEVGGWLIAPLVVFMWAVVIGCWNAQPEDMNFGPDWHDYR